MAKRRNAIFHGARLIVAAAAFWASLANSQGRPEISFSLTRDGDYIQTDAHVELPVAPSLAWSVLTDYEAYPRFISSMAESKIVSRGPAGLVVEQKGRFSVLFFSQAIKVRLQVSEFPPNAIESRAIDGDFRAFTGRYELLATGKGVRLSYAGRLLPKFYLPPLIGTRIMRHVQLENFNELVGEMLRRDTLARSAASIE